MQQDPADPYHNYPMFAATGGYVFGVNDDGTYNPQDLGLASPGAIAAGENFSTWAKEGLISSDVSFDIMIQSFASGKAPFAITGPWAVTQIQEEGRRRPEVRRRADPARGRLDRRCRSSASRASCSRRSPRTPPSPRSSSSTT